MSSKDAPPPAARPPRTEDFTARQLYAAGLSPFGEVFPPRERSPLLPLPTLDPRTAALRVLRLYVSELTFYRPGGTERPVPDPPVPFRIAPDRFHIGQPDSVEDLVMPCIAVTEGKTTFDSCGLVNQVDESTRDKFGPGTVLNVLFEQLETIVLEIHGTKRPELRALVAGLLAALSPTEQMYGIRFLMPEYFFEPVCFTPVDASYDDVAAEVVRGHRVVKLRLEMRFNVVAPVAYETFKPSAVVEAADDEVEVTL